MTTMYEFVTKNGCSYTRERLMRTNKSVEIKGWNHARDLYMPTEFDSEFFPGVEYRLCLTPDRAQDDELFCSIPCRIKPGTKTIMEFYGCLGKVENQVKIRNLFIW